MTLQHGPAFDPYKSEIKTQKNEAMLLLDDPLTMDFSITELQTPMNFILKGGHTWA